MTKPGVQNPHCMPWLSQKASCTGCSLPLVASPSIVVTCCPLACTANSRHERTASPLTSTVHAPQTPCSQPRWVPVSPRSSRRKSASVRRASAIPSRRTPFTVSSIVCFLLAMKYASFGKRNLPYPVHGFGQCAAYKCGSHIFAIRGAGMDIAGRINVFNHFRGGSRDSLFIWFLMKKRLLCTQGTDRRRSDPDQRNARVQAGVGAIQCDCRCNTDQRKITMSPSNFHE